MNFFQARSKNARGVDLPKCMRLVAVILGTLLFSLPAFAQGSLGTILGTVTDQSGGAIAGAKVTIINTQTGVSRTLTSTTAGVYNAPALNPGIYVIRVTANGFKTFERQKVDLQVGASLNESFTLQPGTQLQTVTVTAAAPLINVTTATLGGTIQSSVISNLPLNGGNYQYLVTLRPGIMIQPGGGPWTVSTNGLRPDTTEFYVEGIPNVSWYDARSTENDSSPFTDAATILPVDSITQFNMKENPPAQYGWRDGGVVDVGIKSGTNKIHGDAYANGRNGSWDARNVFNVAPSANGSCVLNPAVPVVCAKTPTQLEEFGGSAGGPILKNKLFYFGAYEGLRSTIGSTFATSVPETGTGPTGPDPTNSMVDAISALQAGGFTQLCSATVTATCLSPVSLDMFGCTGTPATIGSYACTGGLIANDPASTTLYESSYPIASTSDNGLGKINYTINPKNTISGMFWSGHYAAFGQDKPSTNALFLTPLSIVGYNAIANWVYVPNSRWVNELRFGWAQATYHVGTADAGIIPNGKGGLCTASGCGNGAYPLDSGTGAGGMTPIGIGSFASGQTVLGNANSGRPDKEGPSAFFDFQDNVSYLWGRNSFHFGGEYIDTYANQNVLNKRGNIVLFSGGENLCSGGATPPGCSSTPLEDYFAGSPSFGNVNVGSSARYMHWNQFALYAEDDWLAMPRLMLNLGLRWEYSQPIREVNNLYGNFDPTSQYGMVQQGQPGVGSTLWKPTYRDFAPRLGFAWNMSGKGTTVLRGGFGIMYTEPIARYIMDNAPSNGSAGNVSQDPTAACSVFFTAPQTCTSAGGHTFGGTVNFGAPTFEPPALNWNGVLFPQGGLACTTDIQCSLYAVSPNLKTPYTINYNVDIQHLITSTMSVDVAYVGNEGRSLLSPYDANQCAPNTTGACVRPYSAQFPYLSIINLIDNHGYSNFNSLQVSLTQRTYHGLSYIAGYTWGHALDNGSLNLNQQPPQNSLNRAAEYATSDFNINQRFTLALTYAIPGVNGFAQMLKGWKLNTILTLQTAQPWLAFDTVDHFSTGGNALGDGTDRWDFFGNPSNFRSGPNSIMHCTGPADGDCSQTHGTTGIAFCGSASGACDAATSAALWAQCTAKAPDPVTLGIGGCYVSGNSVMVPPAMGTYGTMGRNLFRDQGFKGLDFAVYKEFRFKERYSATFKAEAFNLFNHPTFANPYGSSNTNFIGSNPASPSTFGCGCATPDVAAGNPVIGSGSNRVMQLGLKLTF